MSKRKAKPQNFLQYFLNEFIFFRRDFVFETPLSPEQATEKLQQLNFENQGCGRSRRIIADVKHEADEITFVLKAEQASRNSYSQSAKAEGTIFLDEQGMTVVEGTVTMGGLAYWLSLLFVLVFIIYIYLRSTFVSILLFYAIIPIYMWLRMYSDRNYLIQIIDYAVNAEKAKSGH